jgi:DNA-binding CsgD family transcriptional regulator
MLAGTSGFSPASPRMLAPAELAEEVRRLTRRELHVSPFGHPEALFSEILAEMMRRGIRVIDSSRNSGAEAEKDLRSDPPIVIRDRTVLYLPLAKSAASVTFYWAELCSARTAEMLAIIFESMLKPPRSRPATELSPEQHAILRVLNNGHLDERAAHELGLSPRTFTRRVSDLMTLLGATSRFQFGVAAVKHGFI